MDLSYFSIENTTSGAHLGEYLALSEEEAIAAMLREAGCTDPADPCLVATPIFAPRIVEAIEGSSLSDDIKVIREANRVEVLDAILLSDGFAEENDGSIDAWGATDEGPWRIRITPERAGARTTAPEEG